MVESLVEAQFETNVSRREKTPIRVLLVDDDERLLNVIEPCLEMKGPFQVETAGSAKRAISRILEERFDVIVSDYEMPEKNGLQFLEELKQKAINIPFILFTERGQEEIALKALNLGAFRYVNKHGDPETVYTELASCIQQAANHTTMQDMLRKSEERFKAIFNCSRDAIIVLDDTGIITYLNEAAMTMFNCTKDVLGQVFFERFLNQFPGASKQHMQGGFKQFAVEGKGRMVGAKVEVPLQKPDGEVITVELSMSSFKEISRWYAVAIIREITERNETKRKLQESEERYRSLFEQSPLPVGITALDGTVIDANSAMQTITGYSLEELKKINAAELYENPEDRKAMLEALKRHGVVTDFSTRLKRKDGVYIDIVMNVSQVHAGGKSFLRTALQDVTERKKAEEEIRRASEDWSRTFDAISDFVFVLDKDLRIEKVNKAVLNVLKKKPDELVGRKCFEALHGTDEPLHGCPCGEICSTKETISTEMGDPKTGKYSLATASPILDEKGELTGIVHIHKDISALKKQELFMLENQQKFMALFSANPEAVVFVDKDYRVVDVNPNFSELFGYSIDEIKGKDIGDIVVPDDRKSEYCLLREKILDGTVKCNSVRKKKDGSLVNVSLSGAPVTVNNTAIGFVMVYKDITEIVTAQCELDKALANAELLNEKLSVVGNLTRHDIKNKLCSLNGYLHLANKRLGKNPEAETYLQNAQEVVKSIDKILDFSRYYEKLGSGKLSLTDVYKMFQDAAMLFADLKGVKITNECNGLVTSADSLLMDAFHNLIDNSLKYGEKITQIRIRYERNTDGSINLIYEDDGVGIEANMKERLFQKGFGKGTGYGLYLIWRICDVYGWSVQENGQPGKGVRFEFKIPAKQ